MGAALKRLRLAITQLSNAMEPELWDGLHKFSLPSPTEMAVVFHACYDIEADKHNFLVPVDARLETDADVEFETLPLDLPSWAVDQAKDPRLIILDACCDNSICSRDAVLWSNRLKREGACAHL